ncbi:hypothetical protein [cf. Phormidesmis sp. LEGE 11477]|uniref:hypothetical protein n=1 Tax=cf. Phormidesmis sp. LEGE 11477 TaxID=1828680 RepID=UPI001881B0A2|nr:hypothetical protein [cf. Phormidesmis sp. LEGE 11477]MBE9061544.1 hypothetical protein [cf. Phormidesmis sp. LEGE 11477]
MTTDASSIITHFADYAAEGDEPADLLLKELIPPQLSELDLPHAPKKPALPAKEGSIETIRIPCKLYKPATA